MLFYDAKNSTLMARPRLNRKIVRTSVSLDEQMFSEVFQLAAQNDVSVAWLVRKAVAELLERHRGELEPQLPLLSSDFKLQEYKK
ncbi:ribbon-helix-helix domain-containing protein [Paraburkholderia eburnea]|uniref:ribbon-helix-helix domain-containing protein n=1 Tax=Paraburkholderia eburnea TaxID=1189126 RepID=UPI00142DAC5C|nr:ribbon-helix-helix domain-containing protein [Paraburkholderia eburnea]